MHLLPASLAILPGGEVPARHTCNGAAFFPVADNVGAAECGQAPRPRPGRRLAGTWGGRCDPTFPGTSWSEPITADGSSLSDDIFEPC